MNAANGIGLAISSLTTYVACQLQDKERIIENSCWLTHFATNIISNLHKKGSINLGSLYPVVFATQSASGITAVVMNRDNRLISTIDKLSFVVQEFFRIFLEFAPSPLTAQLFIFSYTLNTFFLIAKDFLCEQPPQREIEFVI